MERVKQLSDFIRDVGTGKISAARVLAIVALREQCAPEDIREVTAWMRRLVKPTPAQVKSALEELSPRARLIVVKELAKRRRVAWNKNLSTREEGFYAENLTSCIDTRQQRNSIRLTTYSSRHEQALNKTPRKLDEQ